MEKVEGHVESWHGHVTAVTVAPEYRRQQLAKKMMIILEDITEKTYGSLLSVKMIFEMSCSYLACHASLAPLVFYTSVILR